MSIIIDKPSQLLKHEINETALLKNEHSVNHNNIL